MRKRMIGRDWEWQEGYCNDGGGQCGSKRTDEAFDDVWCDGSRLTFWLEGTMRTTGAGQHYEAETGCRPDGQNDGGEEEQAEDEW